MQQLTGRADAALYAAKRGARHRVKAAGTAMTQLDIGAPGCWSTNHHAATFAAMPTATIPGAAIEPVR